MFIFLIIGCFCFLSAILIYIFQENFIFLKRNPLSINYPYKFSKKFKEVFIKTDGNNVVNALHFQLSSPKGVVLFCHGNKGNLTKWGDRVSYFLDYNYEVFVFDYLSYGKSRGKLNEVGLYNDAIGMYNYLKKHFKEENIVVYGYSLGGTFATKIASVNSPKELILEAPFYNLKKAAKYKFKCAPTFLLKYQFRSDKYISNVTCPITVFHGNKDNTTSYNQSKRLIELNVSTNNKFVEINSGTHHNLTEFTIYKENLKEILDR